MAGISGYQVKRVIERELSSTTTKLDPQLRDVVKRLVNGVAKAIEDNNQQIDYDIKYSIDKRL